ncbi:MAG: YfiR family protein [Thiohalomonadales bacterium]
MIKRVHRGLRGKIRLISGACLLLSVLMPLLLFAATARIASSAAEYQIKAAYLYNFSQFIEWPSAAFEAPASSFNLCVFGKDPFGESLRPIADRVYRKHPISIRYPKNIVSARSCHILYIANSEAGRFRAVLDKLSGAPVLVVSSLPNFVDRGGIVGFERVGSHVRFAINQTAGMRNGLSYSAKLLEVAVRIVGAIAAEGSP